MKIKQHPEWTEKYSAIDGIAKPKSAQNSIRSDIEEILKFSDEEFYKWYETRKNVTVKLLQDYQLFSTIPALKYGSEEQKLDMTAYIHVDKHLQYLKKGLEYLLMIKTLREEIKGPIVHHW